MKAALFIAAIAGLSLTAPVPSFAYLAGGEIHLQVDIFRILDDGGMEDLCSTDVIMEQSASEHWSLALAAPDPDDGEPGNHSNPAITCLPQIQQQPPGEVQSGVDESHQMGQVSLAASVVRQMEDERIVLVQLEIRTPVGQNLESQSVHPKPAVLSRKLIFSDDATAYIPISLPKSADGGAIEAELFIRLNSAIQLSERDSVFGAITIVADIPGATVLLDGGVVGAVSAAGDLHLDLVPPGQRRVSLISGQGSESVQFVHVKPSRTSMVSFAALKSTARKTAQFALEPVGKNEWGYLEYLRVRDGAGVIEVPGGEFLMGNHQAERTPIEHRVYLPSFLIDKTAVTWGQYKKFVSDTGIPMPPHKPYWGVIDDHPAVYVTWQEARSYCQWAGGRLPTEAEREKAARGTDGRMYPWGDDPPTPDRGVFRRHWGDAATDPVGIRPLGASPYGAMDMGGNVWEWCADWYSDEYLASSPYESPTGPEAGLLHVLRGGSWDSRPDVLSASVRNWGHPGYREGDFGFRCAMNTPSK